MLLNLRRKMFSTHLKQGLKNTRRSGALGDFKFNQRGDQLTLAGNYLRFLGIKIAEESALLDADLLGNERRRSSLKPEFFHNIQSRSLNLARGLGLALIANPHAFLHTPSS